MGQSPTSNKSIIWRVVGQEKEREEIRVGEALRRFCMTQKRWKCFVMSCPSLNIWYMITTNTHLNIYEDDDITMGIRIKKESECGGGGWAITFFFGQ